MNSLDWKRCIGKAYFKSPLFSKNYPRKIILIYHAIGNGPWAISENHFAEQIEWLKRNAEIVSLNDLCKTNTKNDLAQVALTFDDGYACIYDTVFPILSSANAVGTVYLNTGWISESHKTRKISRPDLGHYPGESFLTWDEVKKLDQAGWEIGSHGIEHYDLTIATKDVVHSEMLNSKITIEEKLNKSCNHYCYTYGKHSRLMRETAESVGYQSAVAGHHQPLKKKDDFFALPRMNIETGYTMDDFRDIVMGKWDFVGKINRLRSIGSHYLGR